MKLQRFFIVTIAALAVVATSCQKQLDSLSNRVEVLEGKVSSLEDAVSALKNAVDSKYAVDKVEKTDNGVNIFFTNGKTIEILNGKDGNDGNDGDDGDTLIKSISETEDSVVIILNDGKDTTFVLAKALRIVIGNPSETPSEEKFICVEAAGDNKIDLDIPAWESIASVKASLAYADGISNAVVTKAAEPAEPWGVKLAKDCSYAIVTIPESAKPGQVALLEITVVKTDGSAVSSSKAIVYQITSDQLYEEFALALEEQQKYLTQVYNSTVMNEENNAKYAENEVYQELVENVTAILSGIQQTIDTKAQWAEESYNNGTLADEIDDIYASFENDIQIPLTQALNLYNDGVLAIENDLAFEAFAAEYESLSQQWTMAYNSTVNSEEYQDEIYAHVIDEYTAIINGIQQNLAAKMTWAEESYNNGTLVNDLEEILASFEEIQVQLTQYLNSFEDAVFALQSGEAAFAAFEKEYRSAQEAWSMVYNKINGEEYDSELYTEAKEAALATLSSIAQIIQGYMDWAKDSYDKGTLAADLDEILEAMYSESPEHPGYGILLTQCLNAFEDATADSKAYEELAGAVENVQKMLTQAMNSTVYFEENEMYTALNEKYLASFSGVMQQITQIQNRLEEDFQAGVLAQNMDEIYESLYGEVGSITSMISQVMNAYNAELAEMNSLVEELAAAVEESQKMLTQAMNATIYNEDYADAKYEDLKLTATAGFSGIAQQITEIQNWIFESLAAGTLADDTDDIYNQLSGERGINAMISQVMMAFLDEAAKLAE